MAIITSRDSALFRELGKYGMLTTSQIEQRIFPGVQSSTVLRRLRALTREGLIYSIKALENGELVWLLSRQGEREIGLKTSMIKPNRNGVAHGVELTRLRMDLESVGLGQNFLPEWTIRRHTFSPSNRRREESNIVPDAIFTAVLWDSRVVTVALELELNAKTIQRHERIFKKYMSQRRLDVVWYFVKSQAFGQALRRKWDHAKKLSYSCHSLFVFTVIDDLRQFGASAHVHQPSGNAVPISTLFQVTPPAQAVGREVKAAA